MIGSYTPYQTKLSDKIIHLRDSGGLTYKAIAESLIAQGYRSPRGFELGAQSVFSIYKKRKIRDARLQTPPSIKICDVAIEHLN